MAGDGLKLDDRALDRTADALRVLRAALAEGSPADAGACAEATRIEAVAVRAAPEEGLALLSAFLRISDPAVRQAVLDVVTTIGIEK